MRGLRSSPQGPVGVLAVNPLPPGPLVRHLQAMQDIVNTLHANAQVDMPSLVEAHWQHAEAIATFTALDPYAEPATSPPDTLRVELSDEDVRRLIDAARHHHGASGMGHVCEELRQALHGRTARREASTDFPTEQGDFPT